MTNDDAALAIEIAQEAGRRLLQLRDDFGQVDPSDKARRKQLRDQADQMAHMYIVERLAQHRPGDAILSEEGIDFTDRDSADRVWIVDPLDGTNEYGLGRHDFAVHIALWHRSRPAGDALSVGVVELAGQGVTLSTTDTQPARTTIPTDAPARIVVSRTRPPELTTDHLTELANRLAADGVTSAGAVVLNVGSVGAKVAEVILGRADAYVHDSGFYEWDVAAPLAVARHYGLFAAHIDGSAVSFNHRPPWVENLAVAVPQLAPYVTREG